MTDEPLPDAVLVWSRDRDLSGPVHGPVHFVLGEAMTERKTEFAKRLKEIRLLRSWSQGELAKRMRSTGLPWLQSTVSKVEMGERSVDITDLLGLAACFGIEPGDLLEDPVEGPAADRLLDIRRRRRQLRSRIDLLSAAIVEEQDRAAELTQEMNERERIISSKEQQIAQLMGRLALLDAETKVIESGDSSAS